VGLTCGQTAEHWARDIESAKLASIDGFALNIGPCDSWTIEQLQQAYDTATEAGGFSLFLSFE